MAYIVYRKLELDPTLAIDSLKLSSSTDPLSYENTRVSYNIDITSYR